MLKNNIAKNKLSALLKTMTVLCRLGCYSVLLLLSAVAHASFQLESTGIILNESTGRVSFNIKNLSESPLLMVSKLTDLDGSGFSKYILISPPVTRINGGESQQINFVLKQGEPLTHEILLKASFEGVSQNVENSAKMPIRQEVGFTVQPAAVAQTKTPWEDLKATLEGGTLVLSNPGTHVVRLAPQLILMPENKVVPLENYYLMAGEVKRIAVSGSPADIKITPLSRYGFKLPDISISVKR